MKNSFLIPAALLALTVSARSEGSPTAERYRCDQIVRSEQSRLEQIAREGGREAVQAHLGREGCSLPVRIIQEQARGAQEGRHVRFGFRFIF